MRHSAAAIIPAAALMLGATTSCSQNEQENGHILYPIEEHLVGSWRTTDAYEMVDGEWVRQEPAVDGVSGKEIRQHNHFRSDGTCYFESIDIQQRESSVVKYDWHAGDDSFTIAHNGQEYSYKLLGLTENSFTYQDVFAMDEETGDKLESLFKWDYERIDESELSYPVRLTLGRGWTLARRYVLEGGEWKEAALPYDGLTYDFKPFKQHDVHVRSGETEKAYTGNYWAYTFDNVLYTQNPETGDRYIEAEVQLENDELVLTYLSDYDYIDGRHVSAPSYRDVFIPVE